MQAETARPSITIGSDLMIRGLTYAIVTTDDMPRARRFFTEQLGLSTEDDMGDQFSQFTTREGTMWAVMQAPPHASPKGVELYLTVEDVDESYRTWKSRGVEMVTEPWDAPFGRTFAFKDADGRVLHAIGAASQAS
jgi:predicted enzyme related to lactoylglutathione lyase